MMQGGIKKDGIRPLPRFEVGVRRAGDLAAPDRPIRKWRMPGLLWVSNASRLTTQQKVESSLPLLN